MQPLFSHVRLVLSTYDTQRSTFSLLHYTYIRSTLYDGENSLSRCVSIIVQDSDNTGLFISRSTAVFIVPEKAYICVKYYFTQMLTLFPLLGYFFVFSCSLLPILAKKMCVAYLPD